MPTFGEMIILPSFLSILFSLESNTWTSLSVPACLMSQTLGRTHFTQSIEHQGRSNNSPKT